jgi:hypothetical protein
LAEERNQSRIGGCDIHYHPDSSGLPGSVGANQSEDSSGMDLQAQIVHRGELSETFRDVVEYDGGGVIPHLFVYQVCQDFQIRRIMFKLVRRMQRQCLSVRV